jgi:hypothetical protein
MTTPRDLTPAEREAHLERRLTELERLVIGRPATDPSADWTAFTPTFLSGVTSIGNGDASGYYKVAEGKVTFDLEIVFGGTTTYDGAELQIDIPATVITDTTRTSAIGPAFLIDNSTTNYYPGACSLGYLPEIVYAIDVAGAFRFYFGNPAGDGMTTTSPITLAVADCLKAQVTVPGTLAG